MKKSVKNKSSLVEPLVKKKNKYVGLETHPKKRKQFYFYMLSILCTIVLLASITLALKTKIINVDRDLLAQEEKIEDLDKTKRSLLAKVEGIKQSDEIVEEAKFKLGMVYPEEDQLVYIEIPDRTEENDVNQNVYLNPVLSVLKFFNRD